MNRRIGLHVRKLRTASLGLLAVVLAAGSLAPFTNADRYRPRIQAALETALNRRVELGAVHLNLFTGPGFTVDDVLIYDDPRAGIEPFAHVESMRARITLRSLFGGALAFSTLRLAEPSVNLVKTQAGPWNVEPLLMRAARRSGAPETAAGRRSSLPDIQISAGRLNFKFGDTKSVFYINDADVEVYPNDNGDVVIRFSGAPARTDRGAQGFGRFTARGILQSNAAGEDRLSLGLHLERTSIADLTTLLNGGDIGVHGFAIANARLAGPLSKLEIAGDLSLDEVHRWDLMPVRGETWNLGLRGLLNWPAQRIELETAAAAGRALPVSVKFRADRYLSALEWSADVALKDLPAASLVEAARHMGAPLPGNFALDGKVRGAIGYSGQAGMRGSLVVENGAAKLPQGVSLAFEAAPVTIAGNQVTFGPSEVQTDDGQTALVEAHYALDSPAAGLKVSSRELTVSGMRSGITPLLDAAPIPVVERLREGTFKGWLAFERADGGPGAWTGEYELQNAALDVPGLAAPVRLSSAAVRIDDDQAQISHMRAHAGPVKFEADYRFDLAGLRAHRLRLFISTLEVGDLEKLLLPTLRRQEGFLVRTFGLRRAPAPAWLSEREIEGSVQVKQLLYGNAVLGTFEARLAWSGAQARLIDIECQGEDVHGAGTLAVDLSKSAPVYHAAGRVDGLDYRGGRLSFEGELDTSGLGPALLANAQSEGSFSGADIALGPDAALGAISGVYRWSAASVAPRLQLLNLQVEQNGDVLYGQGGSQPDGRIVLDLASGRKQVRLTGMLLPMHPEPAPAR